MNILFKTLVAELYIDKIVRVNDTQAENGNEVLVAVMAQLQDCTLLVSIASPVIVLKGFVNFHAKSLSVILISSRRNTIAVVVLRICNNWKIIERVKITI